MFDQVVQRALRPAIDSTLKEIQTLSQHLEAAINSTKSELSDVSDAIRGMRAAVASASEESLDEIQLRIDALSVTLKGVLAESGRVMTGHIERAHGDILISLADVRSGVAELCSTAELDRATTNASIADMQSRLVSIAADLNSAQVTTDESIADMQSRLVSIAADFKGGRATTDKSISELERSTRSQRVLLSVVALSIWVGLALAGVAWLLR
jgi:hypothetical protein